MNELHINLSELKGEVKELSAYIASLKRKQNRINEGPEKEVLKGEIRMRQHQALFYITKIENLAKTHSKAHDLK